MLGHLWCKKKHTGTAFFPWVQRGFLKQMVQLDRTRKIFQFIGPFTELQAVQNGPESKKSKFYRFQMVTTKAVERFMSCACNTIEPGVQWYKAQNGLTITCFVPDFQGRQIVLGHQKIEIFRIHFSAKILAPFDSS